MARVRSVPLIERKAEAEGLADAIREHRLECKDPKACAVLKKMKADLAAGRREISAWFTPNPEERLF